MSGISMVGSMAAAATIRRSSFVLLLLATTAHADLKEDPCACSAAKPGFFRRATLTPWDRSDLQNDGVIVQATYASEAFAAPGLAKQFVVAGLAVLSLDLELDKLANEHLGSAHISTLGIHGTGLS